MHMTFRNVNDAFRSLVRILDGSANPGEAVGVSIVRRPSRNGSVLMVDEPVTVTYERPLERVLFNSCRDASPFFHLYEALWMLAGRNDVAPLAYYSKQMAEYSDDGTTLNGAYGYRWRKATGYDGDEPLGHIDQLDVIVNHLKADPNSRRAVLQMWNVEDDLLKVGAPTPGTAMTGWSKDVCCNLSVMFSLRTYQRLVDGQGPVPIQHLDMTVTNRSNDMIWGMLGANYVHFTMLQEYVAARLGTEVGRYHHFSNNLHVYDEPDKKGIPKWKPDEWLSDRIPDLYGIGAVREHGPIRATFPLVKAPAVFDREVREFVQFHGVEEERHNGPSQVWTEPFLQNVAAPMLDAFHFYKLKCYDLANISAQMVQSDDWKVAALNWLNKRVKA